MAKVGLGSLVIYTGQTKSTVLGFGKLRHVDVLTISAPETLTPTITIQVTHQDDRNTDVDIWKNLQDSGSNIELVAGGAVTISPIAFAGLRLSASVAPASDLEFSIFGEENP